MKRLLASTALAMTLAVPAVAQEQDTASTAFMGEAQADALHASNLIGARLYTSEKEVGEDATGLNDNWEDVGEIGDIIFGKDGQINAVLVDIGGFLGIGEKRVAVNMDQLDFVQEDGGESYFIVVQASREQLENAPEFGADADMQAEGESEMNAEGDEAAQMEAEEAEAAEVEGASTGENLSENAGVDAETEAEMEAAEGDIEAEGNMEAEAEAEMAEAEVTMEQAGEDAAAAADAAGEEVEQAADAAGEEMKDAADAAGTMAAEGAAEVEEAAEYTAQAAEEAAGEAEAEMSEAAAETEQATEEAAAEAEQATEEAAAETEMAAEEAEAEMTAEGETEMAAETEAAEGETEMAAEGEEKATIEGYSEAKIADLTAEDVTGARVYDANDEWVGEISEVLMSTDGKIEGAVVDVGGFLGIGEKPVKLEIDALNIQRPDDGGSIRVYIDSSEAELKELPEYEG